MTRINLVDPRDLADQHLIAEWREIKMIPPALRRSIASAKKKVTTEMTKGFYGIASEDAISCSFVMEVIPDEYTLNKGHVTFFYNKLLFLKSRYALLTEELLNRGFSLSDTREYDVFINDLPLVFHKNYVPRIKDKKINVERILTRLNEKPTFYRYYGETKLPDFFEQKFTESMLVERLS